VTINDNNIAREMNTAQISIDPCGDDGYSRVVLACRYETKCSYAT